MCVQGPLKGTAVTVVPATCTFFFYEPGQIIVKTMNETTIVSSVTHGMFWMLLILLFHQSLLRYSAYESVILTD